MPGKHIIVVCAGDGAQNVEFGKMLMDCGFSFSIVENTDELLISSSKRVPQLIFVCPSMIDNQFVDYLTTFSWKIPVIALLTLRQNQIDPILLRIGITDYLELPSTPEIIIDTTRRAFETQSNVMMQQQLIDDLEKTNHVLLRQLHGFKVLLKIARSISKKLDTDTVLNRITEAAVFTTGAEEGYLLLVDKLSGKLKLRAAQNLDEKQSRNFDIDISDSIAGQVVQSAKPVMLDGDSTHLFKVKTGLLVKALLNVPLISDEQVIGVLGVDNKTTMAKFSQHHLEQLSLLAGIAATAIGNARQYGEAHAVLSARELEFSFFQELAKALSTVTNFETGAELALSVSLEKLNADAGQLYWFQPTPEKPISIFKNRASDVIFNIDTFQNWCQETLFKQAGSSDELILYNQLPKSLSPNGTCLIVPLKDKNRAKGAVILLSTREDTFSAEDVQLMANSAEYMTIALDTIGSRQQARTDSRRLKSLLDVLDNGVWFFDSDLKLVTQNRVANGLVGKPAREVIGLPIEELLLSNNGSPHLIVKLARQALLEQHPITFSNSLMKLRDRPNPILVTGHLMPEIRQKKVVGVICTLWEVQSTRANEHLEKEFAQMASHLFRTPISIIQTSIDLLLDAKPDENESTEILRSMRKQSVRLVDTTNEMLKILRVETEGLAVQCLPIAIIPIVNRAIKLVENDNPSITFDRVFSSRMPLALGDEAKTELVVFNLLLNAIRRCSKGGHITVSVQNNDYEIMVSIEDTGEPIADEEKKRIFQQFYAVDDSGETMPSTYNFGLYSVIQLVALQRGRIGVESELGATTKFFFSLPVWEGNNDKNIGD